MYVVDSSYHVRQMTLTFNHACKVSITGYSFSARPKKRVIEAVIVSVSSYSHQSVHCETRNNYKI